MDIVQFKNHEPKVKEQANKLCGNSFKIIGIALLRIYIQMLYIIIATIIRFSYDETTF